MVFNPEKKMAVGKFIPNKTSSYLVPALGEYGKTFTTKVSNLKILQFGIYDDDLKDLSVIYGSKCIYILFDSGVRPHHTRSSLDWFANQEFYVDCIPFVSHDYPLKLLIIEFPEVLEGAYDKFLLGKYSEMYTKDEIKKYFDEKKHKEALEVMRKSPIAAERHKQRIREDFGTTLTTKDLKSSGYQYDYPPKKEEEIFNFKKE